MGTLLILLIIQIAGIIFSSIVYCFIQSANKRKVFIAEHYNASKSQQNCEWLIDYFQAFPGSRLKHYFPDSYRTAQAIKRYKQINLLRKKGIISERKYEKKLKEILPLIDIKSDLEFEAHK